MSPFAQHKISRCFKFQALQPSAVKHGSNLRRPTLNVKTMETHTESHVKNANATEAFV
jgi:hypothetical protein